MSDIAKKPAAGISIEDAFPPERLATGHGYDIIVATVVASDGQGSTNANPPTVTLRVEEVLAGNVALGERLAVWAPPPHGVDWSGPGADQALAAWGARPLAVPSAGTRLVVLGRQSGDRYRVLPRLREPYDDGRRAYWIDAIARARKEREAGEAERQAEIAKKAADEARRVAEADPAALVPKARVIVIGTMHTLGIDGNGHHVRVAVKEVLTPELNPPPVPPDRLLFLVGPEEEARFDGEREVLIFAAPRRWESPLGGELDGLRIVDPQTGVLPATTDLVARTRAALRDARP